jgi:hypothetical protein
VHPPALQRRRRADVQGDRRGDRDLTVDLKRSLPEPRS